jgi:hypothetical protein
MLDELRRDFPFVEWGILVSKGSSGASRFPTPEWVRMLVGAGYQGVNTGYSLHLCGSWLRELVVGKVDDLLSTVRVSFFDRVQLNFHGQPHPFDPSMMRKGLTELAKGRMHPVARSTQTQFIFQLDGGSGYDIWRAAGGNVSSLYSTAPFFDLSHGGGVLPTSWPQPTAPWCGYAGGLSAENVAGQLWRIQEGAGPEGHSTNIWIDVETNVRSHKSVAFGGHEVAEANDTLDLEKVCAFLKACQPFVTPLR